MEVGGYSVSLQVALNNKKQCFKFLPTESIPLRTLLDVTSLASDGPWMWIWWDVSWLPLSKQTYVTPVFGMIRDSLFRLTETLYLSLEKELKRTTFPNFNMFTSRSIELICPSKERVFKHFTLLYSHTALWSHREDRSQHDGWLTLEIICLPSFPMLLSSRHFLVSWSEGTHSSLYSNIPPAQSTCFPNAFC